MVALNRFLFVCVPEGLECHSSSSVSYWGTKNLVQARDQKGDIKHLQYKNVILIALFKGHLRIITVLFILWSK